MNESWFNDPAVITGNVEAHAKSPRGILLQEDSGSAMFNVRGGRLAQLRSKCLNLPAG
jgi:hypothetical protein